ncbi:BQ5605_C014g07706 [Microbotryum silenes-dioicae]|uniref:BQ5605_C014g07706 protein n=1 Tax=Microbotryum silenes-dioicae TaxID=796604 RepID=A0A2X0NRZ7_9BASI|nr:BQ5605_C014g07706 [Microbotryum silenes-dioicae]
MAFGEPNIVLKTVVLIESSGASTLTSTRSIPTSALTGRRISLASSLPPEFVKLIGFDRLVWPSIRTFLIARTEPNVALYVIECLEKPALFQVSLYFDQMGAFVYRRYFTTDAHVPTRTALITAATQANDMIQAPCLIRLWYLPVPQEKATFSGQ